jgi:hypothetical protein
MKEPAPLTSKSAMSAISSGRDRATRAVVQRATGGRATNRGSRRSIFRIPNPTANDQTSGALAGASAADATASGGKAPVITATTSLITVVLGLTTAARRPNR